MSQKQTTTEGMKRPPIVVVMGHVDHGKSSLLDYIRKTNVVAGEAGGITQHMGAYEATHNNAHITFIDTPGHAAFSSMRSRGASVADIAILVVGADEGVKAQTLEALESITKARLPYVVAINKIDKPEANIDRTKQSLAEHNIFVEGYGGTIPVVGVSAKTGENIDELLELVLLLADMAELAANPSLPGTGIVIESHRDPRKGVYATLIVRNGTLRKGEFVVVENVLSPLRIIEDHVGKQVSEAGPSKPVRVVGFSEIPEVGMTFETYTTKKEAEKVVLERARSAQSKKTLSDEVRDVVIPIVLKADTVGTLEAIEKELKKLENEKVLLKIVQNGVGTVSETDIKTAIASTDPIVIGFNVKVDKPGTDLADQHGIPIKLFDVIYHIEEWLKEEIEKRTPKENINTPIGKVKILRTFSQTKDKQVLGGEVLEGKIARGRAVRVLRREAVIGEGKVTNLQEQKLQVPVVEAPSQFGAQIECRITIVPGDILEIYEGQIH